MKNDALQTIIESILAHLHVEDAPVERREGRLHVTYHITTDDAALLIGPNGEHLRALTHVVKKIADRHDDAESTPFLIDVNGYQRKRFDAIEREARILAERARTFKTDIAMNPLNAYERMIVHGLFGNDPDIVTESSGEGKSRHIVFKFRERADANIRAFRV